MHALIRGKVGLCDVEAKRVMLVGLPDSLIFKDESKLSPYYIPSLLIHRDSQIKLLNSIYGKMIENIRNVYPRLTQVVGGTGTGKTCTTIKFGELISKRAEEEGVDLRHIYMNCKVDGTTRYVLYGNLIKKVVPEIATRSLSPEEMLRQLVDFLKSEDRFLIASFDEIDYFINMNPKEHIIYDLSRIPEMYPGKPSPVIGEIFISRSLKWHERLEPGEKSTLGIGIIEFPIYTSDQIKDILERRVKEAFQPSIVEEDALDLISDITANAPVNGDLRVGLDLLYYSGKLAENTGFQKVLPDHVRKVYSEMNPTITTEDILNLDDNGKLILLALIRSLQSNKSAYIGLRDIRESYNIVCEELNIKPVGKFEEHVQDLIYRGIIDMKSLTELGISGASLVDLEKFLNNLTQRLRRGLDEK